MKRKVNFRNILSILLCALAVVSILCSVVLIITQNKLGAQYEKLEKEFEVIKQENQTLLEAQEQAARLEEERLAQEKRLEEEQEALEAAKREQLAEEVDYPALVACGEIGSPSKRTESQVFAEIDRMAAEDERLKAVAENKESYPIKLLENLVNNPEMTDFVAGFAESVTGNREITEFATLTTAEKEAEYPLFLQWDPRWGYNYYGDDSVIGLAGCGPTCLAMVIYTLTRMESITPDVIANFAMEKEYYMYGTGTLWALMEELPQAYGVFSASIDRKEEIMKAELDRGNLLIVSVGEGDFTLFGHFIEIYGYDENGFYVNDPNCVYRTGLTWSFDRIRPQIKNIWSVGTLVPEYPED